MNFDEISQQKIFDSINSNNFNQKNQLAHDYLLLKAKIGKIPMMIDFHNYNARDPISFVDYSKSYLDFVNLMEDQIRYDIPNHSLKLLQYLCKEINNGKRIEESTLLEIESSRSISQILLTFDDTSIIKLLTL